MQGNRALEWGPGRLPGPWDVQAQCFHPLSSENRLLNCAWSLVNEQQKWKSQSSGGKSTAVHQSLVFTYSSTYEDTSWIMQFGILYISPYFIRGSLQFIKIWSPIELCFDLPALSVCFYILVSWIKHGTISFI